MPTIYTKDQFFDDYLTGLNTGVSFNGASSLGASHAYKPPPPPTYVPPVRQPVGHRTGQLAPAGGPARSRGYAPARPPRPRPATFWAALRALELHAYLANSWSGLQARLSRSRTYKAVLVACALLGAVAAAANLPEVAWYFSAPLGGLAGYLALPLLLGVLMLATWLVAVLLQWALVLGVLGGAGFLLYVAGGALLG